LVVGNGGRAAAIKAIAEAAMLNYREARAAAFGDDEEEDVAKQVVRPERTEVTMAPGILTAPSADLVRLWVRYGTAGSDGDRAPGVYLTVALGDAVSLRDQLTVLLNAKAEAEDADYD
jgi:hypothetical protein